MTIDGHETRPATDQDEIVVYVIQAYEGGPAKIGYTGRETLRRRLSALQIGNPSRLVVRSIFAGGPVLEKALHNHFSENRLGGEWFHVSDELANLADAIPQGDRETDTRLRKAYEAGFTEGWQAACSDMEEVYVDHIRQGAVKAFYKAEEEASKAAQHLEEGMILGFQPACGPYELDSPALAGLS